ncbi:MAG: sigma-70 family RNA polymerase sigma factor, partial [Gemmatimonadaceae bacterium]|nr:sigma-70 family RNA polymerase sigma factor [Gemmatimonadaceae bacterium]
MPAAEPAAPTRHLTLLPSAGIRDRLVARDERALTELVEQLTPWLLGITQSMLRDADAAEEVVFDTFRQLWDRAASLPPGDGAVIPWLLTIARNRAIDRLRAERRRTARGQRLAAVEAGESPTSEPGRINEAAMPGWHVHERVHAELRALPADQQDALRLAWFGGLSHTEIAEALALPLGTVKTRLRRAHLQLRSTLADLRDWL